MKFGLDLLRKMIAAEQDRIITLSQFIILHFQNMETPISHLKLHKLLYYSQAWYMVNFDRKMLFEDQPEAWVNGPVYPVVYRAFSSKKDSPLKINSTFSTPSKDFDEKKKLLNLSPADEAFMYSIFHSYGPMSDLRLVYETHEEKPWLEARKNIPPFARSTEKISFDTMYRYYKDRVS